MQEVIEKCSEFFSKAYAKLKFTTPKEEFVEYKTLFTGYG